jgi:hypothetical protein
MLDRVVNVYPDWQRLIRLSAERGRRLYGLVYPRDTPFVRAAIFALTSYCADRSAPRSITTTRSRRFFARAASARSSP